MRRVLSTNPFRFIRTQARADSFARNQSQAEQERELLGRKAVVLYDGECPLCSNVVRSVIRFDPKKVFSFASIHSMVWFWDCLRGLS